jgi:hypothetical protein
MFKRFEVKDQPEAFIWNWTHIAYVTDNVDTGWIKILEVLFDIAFPWKKGLIVIWFPSCAGIENGLLKRNSFNDPFYVIEDCLSHLSLKTLSPSSWKI